MRSACYSVLANIDAICSEWYLSTPRDNALNIGNFLKCRAAGVNASPGGNAFENVVVFKKVGPPEAMLHPYAMLYCFCFCAPFQNVLPQNTGPPEAMLHPGAML